VGIMRENCSPTGRNLNTAPLIAGNRRGQVYLLGFCEVARRFHQ